MAGQQLNPTHYRSVPIDPESRLPHESDVLAPGIAYEFGAARPARILKAVPGQRGTVDRDATMRANLHTVDGESPRGDLHGSWAKDGRGLGSPSKRKSTTGGAGSASRAARRSDSSSNLRESAGRFAHAASASELDGVAYHLSNLDIGAGTPGDSMVTQFPLYRTPLVHPYLPSAAVAAQILQADPNDPRPMNPAMFAASIDQLRSAAGAVRPSSSTGERVERGERGGADRSRNGTSDAPNADSEFTGGEQAKVTIDRYMTDAKIAGSKGAKARHSSSGGVAAARPSRADRERTRYEDRVAHLESQLLGLRTDAEKQAARDAWRKSEAKYARAEGAVSASVSAARERAREAELADEPLDAAGRQAAQISQLHSSLARGETRGREFASTLDAVQTRHKANLRAVEDLYYQHKLTADLATTLVDNSAKQIERMSGTAGDVAFESTLPRRTHQQSAGKRSNAYADDQEYVDDDDEPLSEVTSPRELAYRMSRSLRRDKRQTAPGVADADDARENVAKQRLAATFNEDDRRGRHPPPAAWREVSDDETDDEKERRKYEQHRTRDDRDDHDVRHSKRRDERKHDRYDERKAPAPRAREDDRHRRRSRERDDDRSDYHDDDDIEAVSLPSSRAPRGRERGGRARSRSESRSQSRSRSRSASNLSDRSRSRSPRSRSRSHSRSRSESRSRSRSPPRGRDRQRGRGRSESRSQSPSASQIASGLAQPRHLSRSEKAARASDAARAERRQRRREEHGDSDVEAEGLSARSSTVDLPPRRSGSQSPRDIAPDIDDGLTPAQQRAADAAAAARAREAAGVGRAARPSTAGPGGRDHARSQSRGRNSLNATAPPLDYADVFPQGKHNARALAEERARTSTINRAHAFGPGKVLLDENNRPRTAQPRARSRSAVRGGTRSDGEEAVRSESDGGGDARPRASRLTEPEPFEVGARSHTPSRTKQRLLEYLGEVKAREESHTSRVFKAVPLPVSTLEPRYEKMKAEEKARSRQLRRERRALTAAMVKPFEFAASNAIAARKAKKDGNGDAADNSDAEQSATESEDESRAHSKKKKTKKNKFAADEDAVDANEASQSDSDASSEAASQASYQVAFGVTTRKEPRGRPSSSVQQVLARAGASNPHARVFKANKIPWTSQVNLLDGLVKEREKSREERVRERAKALLESSALPNRMEMHKKKQERSAADSAAEDSDRERRRKKRMPPEPTYQPHVNKNLPDFDRLHAEFASDLDRVKRSREVTRVREFDITKSKKKPVVQEEPKQFRAKPYIPAPPPEDVPQPTKKTKDMIERNQARLKAREAKELAADLERRERLKQNPEMQSKLIPRIAATHAHGSATTDETIRALTRQARKELKEKDEAWATRVDEMKQRVRSRPLLVESYNSAAGRIDARKKALIAIKESLDKAGIKNQAKFFDAQELADLDLKF